MIIRPDNQQDWNFAARALVKNLLAKHNISYADLAQKLTDAGIPAVTPVALKNKINRGTFSTVFLMQVCCALEIKRVRLRRKKRR